MYKLSDGLSVLGSALELVMSTPQFDNREWECGGKGEECGLKGRQTPGELRGLWKHSCHVVDLFKWHSIKSGMRGQGGIFVT